MQTDWNELYRLTAERTGKSEDLYKEIGNAVFRSLAANVKRPKTLIIKLKGVGSWFLRKTRIEKTVELFPPNFDKKPNDDDYKLKILSYENKVEIYNLFKERIEDYKNYVAQKKRIQEIRRQTQKLIEPTNEE